MAKALFGSVVAPAELRVATRTRSCGPRCADSSRSSRAAGKRDAARDAVIAPQLLSLAGDNAEPALA
jgi:hypothetical protein